MPSLIARSALCALAISILSLCSTRNAVSAIRSNIDRLVDYPINSLYDGDDDYINTRLSDDEDDKKYYDKDGHPCVPQKTAGGGVICGVSKVGGEFGKTTNMIFEEGSDGVRHVWNGFSDVLGTLGDGAVGLSKGVIGFGFGTAKGIKSVINYGKDQAKSFSIADTDDDSNNDDDDDNNNNNNNNNTNRMNGNDDIDRAQLYDQLKREAVHAEYNEKIGKLKKLERKLKSQLAALRAIKRSRLFKAQRDAKSRRSFDDDDSDFDD